MRRAVTPSRLLIAGLTLVAVVLALMVLPSNEYVFLPDRAHPVAPLVTIKGGHDPARGGVYFVDVIVKKASLFERMFGGLHEGADLYPAGAINPPGVNDAGRRRIDIEDMHRSQAIAAAVALRTAGKKVTLRSTGALVDAIDPTLPAAGKLEPDDVIVAIDGKRITSPKDVFKTMGRVKAGQSVRITIRRDKQTLIEQMKTVPSGPPINRAIVGVSIEPAVDIKLPIPVRIDAGNVGGPSAGLAFALEVLEEMGRDVVHGHKIAATGEIRPDGTIGSIGGIKQKTIGAREAGVDAFLVPAGDNARVARQHADGLRIIPVETFPQALRALATLGPNA